MSRPRFDPKELEKVGEYPIVDTDAFAICGMDYLPGGDKLARPITPRQNYLLKLAGKKPYWIPFHGVSDGDVRVFLPRMNQEFIVRHTIMDGEARYPYTSNTMKSNWFDLEWEYVAAAGGSTVHPGHPKVPDITRWEEYVSLPDIDSFDFEECARRNAAFFETDKLYQTAIFTGFWERLMSLMDVDNAAVALIDEEQQEGVHRLFDGLADFYCAYISRMAEYFPIDMFQIHDDWGHQNSTFFSPATAREMLLPYMKRVVDHCHSLGLTVELHSCGKNERLVPVIIEAGIDLWCPQTMNDIARWAQEYRHERLIFGVPEPALDKEASDEELRAAARAWVEQYKDLNVVAAFMDAPALFKFAVYEYSRIAYENEP